MGFRWEKETIYYDCNYQAGTKGANEDNVDWRHEKKEGKKEWKKEKNE